VQACGALARSCIIATAAARQSPAQDALLIGAADGLHCSTQRHIPVSCPTPRAIHPLPGTIIPQSAGPCGAQ